MVEKTQNMLSIIIDGEEVKKVDFPLNQSVQSFREFLGLNLNTTFQFCDPKDEYSRVVRDVLWEKNQVLLVSSQKIEVVINYKFSKMAKGCIGMPLTIFKNINSFLEKLQFYSGNEFIDPEDELSMRVQEVIQADGKVYVGGTSIEELVENANRAEKYLNTSIMSKIGITEQECTFDIHKNPLESKYDLGKDGAFGEFSILIGCFYKFENLPESIQNTTVIPALNTKGFIKITMVHFEDEFTEKLKDFDQAWVISSNTWNRGDQNTFAQKVIEFSNSGRGIMLWGDNTPYFVQANIVLQKLVVGYSNNIPIQIQLVGNNFGDKVLTAGNSKTVQQFGEHQITTGLNFIHEGITICYPQVFSQTPKDNFGDIEIIGTSSDKQICIFALPGNSQRGRIIIDCGWTKLIKQFWDKAAGNNRYVINSAVWLLWIEREK